MIIKATKLNNLSKGVDNWQAYSFKDERIINFYLDYYWGIPRIIIEGYENFFKDYILTAAEIEIIKS